MRGTKKRARPPLAAGGPLLLLLLLLGLLLQLGTTAAGQLPSDDDSPIALNLVVPTGSSPSPHRAARTTTARPEHQRDEAVSGDGDEDDEVDERDDGFRFTATTYNASIAENSMGKTYVTPDGEKMGIQLLRSRRAYEEIKFRIVAGDKEKFFKAEERVVGDFCFLLLRTRTGNVDVLNRERKDHYVLEVRASARRRDGKNRQTLLEAQATVTVTILDTNDLNPLFYPTEYEATVTEDTPMHKSILKVVAEDADLGRNGEIYYSFAEKTDQFAVHPVSGVVTLTRPLR